MDALRVSAGCSIWIRPYDGKSSYRDGKESAIPHEGPAWAPSWSPDGKHVAFYAEDPDGIHVWAWNLQTRASRRVSDVVVSAVAGDEVPLWSADGTRIFSKVQPEPPANMEAKAAGPRAEVQTTRAPWALPGADGVTADISVSGPSVEESDFPPHYPPVDFGAIEVSTGRVTRLVTGSRIASYWRSPDGRWLALAADPVNLTKDAFSYRWNLDVVDLATGKVRTLFTMNQAHGESLRWSPDSRSIAYFSGPREYSSASAFVIHVESGEPLRFAGAADFGTLGWHVPVWDGASSAIYAIDEHTLWRADLQSRRFTAIGTWPDRDLQHIVVSGDSGGEAWSPGKAATVNILARDSGTKRAELIRVDVATGAMQAFGDPAFSIGSRSYAAVVSPSGDFLAYSAQSAQRPPELWLASTALSKRQRLTALNPELDAYSLGEQRLVAFQRRDGTPLEATLLLPSGYEPGKRYPMVVWVYGTHMGSDNMYQFGLTNIGAFNMQMLATRGYAVLFPDVPLSMGAHVRSLMDAVIPAVDKVIELGVADPRRLAVMGQSSGGYATLAIVTQTDRFKAAISCAGFGELASFYGHGWTAWSETGHGAIGAAPWQAPQRYVENSPVYYLDRIQTPILLQATDQDVAVGEFPRHIFTSLQRLKKDATYLRYSGEGHVIQSHDNLVDFWSRITAFLEWHLR